MSPQKPEPDEDEWKALLAAFQMYKAAYGDLKVPSRFIVPTMPPWPGKTLPLAMMYHSCLYISFTDMHNLYTITCLSEKAWGMKLGQRVAAIRSTGKFVQSNEKRRKILQDMGFLWRLRAGEPTTVDDVTFDQIYLALSTFRRLQPQKPLNVPPSFVVPDCDPWPESTRGLPLGKNIDAVRTKSFLKNNPGAKEKLHALGFEFDGKAAANDTRFQIVYDALVTYKNLYGDLLVPQPFVVPENSPEWPENTWGLRLGARVNAIRSQGTFVNTNPDRRVQLDNLGFVWSPPPAASGRRRGRRRRQDMDEEEMTKDEDTDKYDDNEPKSFESTTSAMENLFGPSFDFGDEKFKASNGEESGTPPTWGFEGTRELKATRPAEEAATQTQDEYRPPILLSDTLKAATDNAIALGIIEPIG
jgi:hypothetical protein